MIKKILQSYQNTFKQFVVLTFAQVTTVLLFMAIDFFVSNIFGLSLVELGDNNLPFLMVATILYFAVSVYTAQKMYNLRTKN